jgi:galactokinase
VSDPRADAVAAAFTEIVGAAPDGIWAAPGRVNLIGEHTDYNDGFVLPFALDQRVTLAASPRADDSWSVHSTNNGETRTFTAADLVPGPAEHTSVAGWPAYIAGVVWALREAGHKVRGADLVLTSDVPLGAGLSSSAALECAVLIALVDLNGLDIPLIERAHLARRCENEFVRAPTGLMDQAASTLAEPGAALFLDCRSSKTRLVPLRPVEAGLEVLVVDTMTPHALVSSEYGTRRRSCEEAAELLGVAALRDVSDLENALGRLPDPVMRRRVRHVVTENLRVLDAVGRLDAGDLAGLAPLLDSSHASMRDDFEITVPPVDLAVATARDSGALGARMTGGGFGGCIIALVPQGRSGRIASEIARRFAGAGFGKTAHFVAQPSKGAHRVR